MTYINMDQKYKFLNEVHQSMTQICVGLKHNLQPTAMNAFYYDKIKMNLTDDGHYATALVALDDAERLDRQREKDGNNHKLGEFVREKANLLYEATDQMSQIKEHFQIKFENKSIESKILNDRGIKTMDMISIRDTIDDVIFKQDVDKLKPFQKRLTQ